MKTIQTEPIFFSVDDKQSNQEEQLPEHMQRFMKSKSYYGKEKPPWMGNCAKALRDRNKHSAAFEASDPGFVEHRIRVKKAEDNRKLAVAMRIKAAKALAEPHACYRVRHTLLKLPQAIKVKGVGEVVFKPKITWRLESMKNHQAIWDIKDIESGNWYIFDSQRQMNF